MKTYQNEKVVRNILTEIRCNRCGEIVFNQDQSKLWFEFQEFCFIWGFHSFHDTERWKFELCAKCIDEIVKEFKIPVTVEHYM